jgi:hypothetical protein
MRFIKLGLHRIKLEEIDIYSISSRNMSSLVIILNNGERVVVESDSVKECDEYIRKLDNILRDDKYKE